VRKPSRLEKKTKKKRKVEKEDKPKKGAIYAILSEAISGIKATYPFPHRYYTIRERDGNRSILKSSCDEVVSYVVDTDLAADILTYTREYFFHDENFQLTAEEALSAARYWILESIALTEEPVAVREKSDPGLCFQRLPFDFSREATIADVPLFAEFLTRTSNHDAFCSFVGSLFVPHSDRQQYVYLYGAGGDGKGSMMRLLARVLGKAYETVFADNADNRFWTSNLIGKRLAVFPDSNHSAFIRSGLFKMLTGGDLVQVERKYKGAFTTELSCKFIFVSNKEPELTAEMSDMRRIIYCGVSALQEEAYDSSYEQRLWEEAPAIIGYCINVYKKQCPDNHSIPTEKDEISKFSDQYDEKFDSIFASLFKICSSNEGLTGVGLQLALKSAGVRDNYEIRDFKTYLERKHRVSNVRLRSSSNRQRIYAGLALKTSMDPSLPTHLKLLPGYLENEEALVTTL
jgi:hypothetical protein